MTLRQKAQLPGLLCRQDLSGAQGGSVSEPRRGARPAASTVHKDTEKRERMVTAVRLEPTGAVETFDLPEHYVRQRRTLRSILSGAVDGAVYHRRALIHAHHAGAFGPDRLLNAAAWALAGLWSRAELPHGIYGTAVITGPNRPDGSARALDNDLTEQLPRMRRREASALRMADHTPPADETSARAGVLHAARDGLSTRSSTG